MVSTRREATEQEISCQTAFPLETRFFWIVWPSLFSLRWKVRREGCKPSLPSCSAYNIGNWIGRTIVAAQGHYPIYLTLRRESAPGNDAIAVST